MDMAEHKFYDDVLNVSVVSDLQQLVEVFCKFTWREGRGYGPEATA